LVDVYETVKYDVKCVKLMVLPGKVQGLGTTIKTRLKRLKITATIQPTGYASLWRSALETTVQSCNYFGSSATSKHFVGSNFEVLYKMNPKTATGGR